METFKTVIKGHVTYILATKNHEIQVSSNCIYRMSGKTTKLGYTKIPKEEFEINYKRVLNSFKTTIDEKIKI